jgi:hypothetical protein
MTVTLSRGHAGTWLLTAETGEDRLFQSDWDWPGLASNFGFVPCPCGRTDGTVNCEHRTAGEMIAAASEFLDEHEGESIEDPGYFEGESDA